MLQVWAIHVPYVIVGEFSNLCNVSGHTFYAKGRWWVRIFALIQCLILGI